MNNTLVLLVGIIIGAITLVAIVAIAILFTALEKVRKCLVDSLSEDDMDYVLSHEEFKDDSTVNIIKYHKSVMRLKNSWNRVFRRKK